jgi:hypothetical protein
MEENTIPENIRRFILTSINSVPHLEAVLLLRSDPHAAWDAKMMAQGLFVSEKKANELLMDLCAAGFLITKDNTDTLYCYQPRSHELSDIINQLSEIYSKNLIEVTNLIHSNTNKQAQKFGDAFKWQNKKDRL